MTARLTLGSLLLLLLASMACTPSVDSDTRLSIARNHAERGDHVTAILELKNLLQTDRKNVTALVLLGRMSLHAGQSAEAIRYLRRALSQGAPADDILEPLGRAIMAQGRFEEVLTEIPITGVSAERRGEIWLLHAQALANLGKTGQARAAFEQARTDRNTRPDALAGLAALANSEGDYAGAESLLEQAFDADPFSVMAHRTRGAMYLERGRYEEALQSFVRGIEATGIRPGAEDLLLARVGLTETQWRMGQKNRALGNVKDLLDAYPWHPLPRYLRALLAFDSGEFELASEYLREVLTIVPRHYASQKLLAASEFELGKYASSELLLREYLAANGDDVAMRRLLADAHLRMGNPAGAMSVLLPALDIARKDSEALALLGRASLHSGDARTAVEYFDRAVQADPRNPQLRVSRILALIGAGAIDRAEYDLRALPQSNEMARAKALLELVLLMRKAENERALQYAKDLRQAAPENLHAMLALAELAELRGDSERAVDWLEMARTRNPDAIEPRLLLVRYYHERGDHDQAHLLAVEAVQVQPHKAEALVALAREKLDIGQTELAMRTFDEALRASPESGEALLGLAYSAIRQRNIDAAGDFLSRAVTATPTLLPRAVQMVLEVAEGGDRRRALQLAASLQDASDNLPDAYTAAGDLHMAERRFNEALASYESAMQLTDDPVVAVKSFIAAREAGMSRPARVLQQWLSRYPDDERVRRILENAGDDTG